MQSGAHHVPPGESRETLREAALRRSSTDTVAATVNASGFFKALADPTRLQLLYTIARNSNGPINANALGEALKISAPTVTHHMKKLAASDLVNREQRGKWAYYSVNQNRFQLVDALVTQLSALPPRS